MTGFLGPNGAGKTTTLRVLLGLGVNGAGGQHGADGQHDPAGAVLVEGATPADVGKIAFAAGVELHELRRAEESLEETFLRLVADWPQRRAA